MKCYISSIVGWTGCYVAAVGIRGKENNPPDEVSVARPIEPLKRQLSASLPTDPVVLINKSEI